MIDKSRITKNSVVQVNELGDKDWVGCLIHVSEVKNWGIVGFIRVPKTGNAYVRLRWEKIEYIGQATMTQNC